MKNLKSIVLLGSFILSGMLIHTSCESNKPEDTKEVAEEHNEAKFEENKNEKDAQFLVNAAATYQEEISLSKLAQQKGISTPVKDLAKMMETEHTQLLKDLTALASAKNITLPNASTDDTQEAYSKLNKLTGVDFDKQYADMMVSGHKNAVTIFETASTESVDMDILAYAKTTLPIIRKHMDLSLNCQKECEKL